MDQQRQSRIFRQLKTLSYAFGLALLLLYVPTRASAETAADASYYAGAKAYDAGFYAEAVAHWRSAIEHCHLGAMVAMANLYDTGEGIPSDPEKAHALYSVAANAGDPVAQMNLGHHYATGIGVAPNPIKALTWLGLAARAGQTWARDQFALTVNATSAWDRSQAEEAIDSFVLTRCHSN